MHGQNLDILFVLNNIAITGSASLSYPPLLGQRGGASNALKSGP